MRCLAVKGQDAIKGNGAVAVQNRTLQHNTFRLDNKIAVITGAASGIGRAIAEAFSANGADVRILDINDAHAREVESAIRGQGGKATAQHCDVTDRGAVERAFAELFRRERVDILVNNAGIAHIGNLENTTERDFDNVFQVNVKGVFHCTQACVPHMKESGGGIILNMASIAATSGLADRFAYSMSKGAVVAMTYSVAKDYLEHNIRCNCISPARVHTPFVDGFVQKNYPGREDEMLAKLSQSQPIGRMATPKEVAMLALFLCSEESGFITGADYPIDGGFFKLRG
jgi:Dehydrogenases with different specificities (related to short-chain alcohol dehydrogenases)